MPTTAPYGSWRSPITADLLATGGVRLNDAMLHGDDIYWLESRPTEGGRYVLVRRSGNGTVEDVTPPEINVRTRVHEYGGASYSIADGVLFFSNFSDQCLYRKDRGDDPIVITPEPPLPAGLRYADVQYVPRTRTIFCIQERHTPDGHVFNELVSFPADGSDAPRIIVSGRDFYSYPRVSPDGQTLAWIEWDHPNMPWDGTELYIADIAPDGTVSNTRHIAGSATESIFQPSWSPEGVLHFVSDRTGWWNLYRWNDERVEALAPMKAEFGGPQWSLDATRYAFLADGRIACIYTVQGIDHLGIVEPGSTTVREVDVPYVAYGSISGTGTDRVVVIAGSPTSGSAVISIDTASGQSTVIKRGSNVDVDAGYISLAQPIEFPTTNDQTAYALYYAPHNADFTAPAGEHPPLVVISHGGPSGATSASLSLAIQFWTSRGISVVDVNYGGSTGYGRAYRERLKGTWGITDIDDCVNAARYLAGQGLADPARLAIRGGSAGGYTTLAALTFRDVFAVGASYYGVADLEGLALETHKFESRYLDGLIGPYPEARDVCLARSPIHHTDQLETPMIIFQGLEDKVVPPSQAEAMVHALENKGIPYAYLPFEGEQHGFRRAENIKRSIEAELYFYGQMLGFTTADDIEPVSILNRK